MGLDVFETYVTINTKVVELGTCDADHISMIVLLHTLSEKQTGSDKVPEDDYSSDDEYCSDLGDEVSDAKLVWVIKSNPFKQLVGCLIRFEVGQTHDSVYTLRSLLTDFAIQEVFNFNKVKNDKNRLTWACMTKGCPWRIHASNVGDDTTMQVKTYKNEHTCHRIYKSKEARSKWIAGKFQALVKSNLGIQAGVILDMLKDQFNVHLRAYALMVQQCNLGLVAYIHLLEKTSTFQRMFVSFEAQRKGFLEGCRPFIGIDRCHLKCPYGGVLLSTIALDANSGLYPLAYCICERETFLNWSWFLEQLRVFLRYPDDKPICYMSDRQKGVIGVLKMVSYDGQKLKNLFCKAAKTADRFEFKKFLADIGSINLKAMKYLAEIEPCHWSRHAFDVSIKCESVTNNMTEAFNSMLKDFRPRTYLQLMEFIRRLVMSRFQLRKDECNTWKTDIPPSVNKKILENSEESRILKTLN
ncbi:hypothetical protein EZV62_010823 [Acer yangbiense]|uniref:Transposase MuDR plant domain-containing protein n=1 Tax=Acer yangbiense TaxID=1000413 RepID=A0A5C7I4L8_9ROSI|nr:hypothetical protein EZV62_010823 [Acer yangbiense]